MILYTYTINMMLFAIARIFIFASVMHFSSSQQKDCQCWISPQFREPCVSGPFLPDGLCQSFGCCSDVSGKDRAPGIEKENTPTCFQRLSGCHGLPQCRVKPSRRRACPRLHWTAGSRICQFQGCCYDPTQQPRCFRAENTHEAAGTIFTSRRTPFGQARDMRLITHDKKSPIETFSEVMKKQRDSYEESVALKATLAKLAGGVEVLVQCSFGKHATPCGRPGMTKSECANMLCCWDPRIAKNAVTSSTMCVQPIVLSVPANYTSPTVAKFGALPKSGVQGSDGRIHDEEMGTFEQPEDEYIPNSGRGTFFKSCKVVNEREPCRRGTMTKKECVLNTCCWDDSIDPSSSDTACYKPTVSYQPNLKQPGREQGIDGEWIEFDPMKIEFTGGHIVVDTEKRLTSASPVTELAYTDFNVLLTCTASPFKLEAEGSSCYAGNSRKLCMSLFCCWIENTEERAKGTCVTPAVDFVEEPDFEKHEIPEKYAKVSVEIPDFWRPSLPQKNLFKDEVVLTIFCPYNIVDMKPCGDVDIVTRDECTNSGCCWRPWLVLEGNGLSPCQAPAVRSKNIAEVIEGNYDDGESEPEWDAWEDWSACEAVKPCSAEGSQTRTRSCRTPSGAIVSKDAKEVSRCLGAESESRKCNTFVGCSATSWTTWSPWTECSESCQAGSSVRIRTCLPPQGCPLLVDDRAREVGRRVCNSEMCEKWGRWIDNEDCDARCDSNGTATRFRLCEKFSHEGGRFAITETVVIPKMSATKSDLRALASSQPEAFAVHDRECLLQTIPCVNKVQCRYDWEAWGEWTECSNECTPGTRSRSRRCFLLDGIHDAVAVPDTFCSDLDDGGDLQAEDCGSDRCRKWNDWKQATPCVAKCEKAGFMMKERTCAHDDFRLAAQSPDCFKVRQICEGPPCPEYNWESWGGWGDTCSSYCTPGVVARARRCVRISDRSRADSRLCGDNDFETKPCNVNFCQVWGNWTDEGCDAECGRMGVRRSRRTCLDEDYTDEAEIKKSALKNMTHDCFILTRRCSKQCELSWGEWGTWSDCSSSCSPGSRTRSRNCLREDGKTSLTVYCSKQGTSSIEKESCNTQLCDKWNIWKKGKCKGDCEKTGSRLVKRTCDGHDATWLAATYWGNGAVCYNDTAKCKPTCARWGGWTNFTDCSDPCGPGKKSRRRQCARDGEIVPDGECKPIQGGIIDERECNIFLCTSYSKWKNDFFCIGDCHTHAVRNRTRTCYSGIAPEECLHGTVPCRPRCGPGWGPWSTWSSCNDKCGPGTRTRTRDCLDGSDVLDPEICINNSTVGGSPSDEQACNTNFCHTWSKWKRSMCAAKCNETGVMRRRRVCLQAASVQVPIDCWDDWHSCTGKCVSTWGEWSRWTPCTKTCGPGRRTSVRRCTENGQVVPPRKCEKTKRPQSVRTLACYSMMCNSWSRWTVGPCAVRCGGAGTAIRQRKCLGTGLASPPDNPTEASCYRKEEICGTDPCPNQYRPWTEWGECSSICSPGVQTRTRKCVTNGFVQGTCRSLGPALERRPCNEMMCPKWGPWEFYTPCSGNCGVDGMRRRKRNCESDNYSNYQMKRNHVEVCYQGEVPCQSPKCQ